MCFRTCSAQGTTSDYQSSIASSQSIEGYTAFNFSSSIKPADENSAQADLVKTSGAAEVTGKATMEEISARLSAKLALLEASQQVQHCKVQWLLLNFLMYTTRLICSFSRTNFSLWLLWRRARTLSCLCPWPQDATHLLPHLVSVHQVFKASAGVVKQLALCTRVPTPGSRPRFAATSRRRAPASTAIFANLLMENMSWGGTLCGTPSTRRSLVRSIGLLATVHMGLGATLSTRWRVFLNYWCVRMRQYSSVYFMGVVGTCSLEHWQEAPELTYVFFSLGLP